MSGDIARIKKEFSIEYYDSIPCDPYHLQSIVKLLNKKEVSLHSLLPFFENDAVLLLKILSIANSKMAHKKNSKPIIVRNISHALTLMGISEISEIFNQQITLSTKKQNLLYQVFRYRVEQSKITNHLAQKLSQLNPNIHLDDVRIYSSLFYQPYFYSVLEKGYEANIQFLVEQTYGSSFEVEQHVYQYLLVEHVVELAKGYSLPAEYIEGLKVVNNLIDQIGLEKINIYKCNDLIKFQMKDQRYNGAIITFISFLLLQNASHAKGHKIKRVLMKVLARVLRTSWQKLWNEINEFLLNVAKQYDEFYHLGVSVFREQSRDNVSLKNINKYFECYANDVRLHERFDILSAKDVLTMPLANKSLVFDFNAHFKDQTISDIKSADIKSDENSLNSSANIITPNENIELFIGKLNLNPKAFGTQLPAFASLLETLRIGLYGDFALVFLIDEIRKVLWVGSVSGLISKHPVRTVNLKMTETGVLQHFLIKPSSLWVNSKNREKVKESLPQCLKELLDNHDYFMSTAKNASGKPTGIVLLAAQDVDTWDERCYQIFKRAVKACQL